MTLHTRASRSEQMGKLLIEEHLADVAALAEPFPSTVSHAHFIKRDLGAAVEAGRCTVTMPHPAFASMPGMQVVDVRRTEDGHGYLVATSDGSEFKRYCKGHLSVTWHEPPTVDVWAQLSSPMQYALRYLAGDAPNWQDKPRWNTLKALQTRGLIHSGHLTTAARELYHAHRGDFANV